MGKSIMALFFVLAVTASAPWAVGQESASKNLVELSYATLAKTQQGSILAAHVELTAQNFGPTTIYNLRVTALDLDGATVDFREHRFGYPAKEPLSRVGSRKCHKSNDNAHAHGFPGEQLTAPKNSHLRELG